MIFTPKKDNFSYLLFWPKFLFLRLKVSLAILFQLGIENWPFGSTQIIHIRHRKKPVGSTQQQNHIDRKHYSKLWKGVDNLAACDDIIIHIGYKYSLTRICRSLLNNWLQSLPLYHIKKLHEWVYKLTLYTSTWWYCICADCGEFEKPEKPLQP